MSTKLVKKSRDTPVTVDEFDRNLDVVNAFILTNLILRALMIMICIFVMYALFKNIDTFSNFSSARSNSTCRESVSPLTTDMSHHTRNTSTSGNALTRYDLYTHYYLKGLLE